ncbi:MAG: sigma-E processing peptidase SpoIIGA [Oscillospiraceae bacterium]|nr:sigma-E processing peptidase SpoIIGA [Oscillospiraceae bacterium]
MVVYADVLIFLNTFVNYFIIHITSLIAKNDARLWRQIMASSIGALFSLCIFIPVDNIAIEMLIRLIASCVIVLCCYGFKSIKSFLRLMAVFYVVSFLYVGIMMGLWFLFKTSKIVINSGVVYFDISPIILIVSTLISYISIKIFRRLSDRHADTAERCKLKIIYSNSSIVINAIVDSGHSLTDLFTAAPVIVIDEKSMNNLMGQKEFQLILRNGDIANSKIKDRYRLIPYRSIGGQGLLPAFRCDMAEITIHQTVVKNINKPIVAVSNVELGEDYSAIISPEMLI